MDEQTRSIDNLISRFEDAARSAPQRLAVAGPDGEATFAQLEARTRALAAELVRRGVARGHRVGVCLPRGVELLTALLAVWRAGAAYVPLDPEYPQDRLAFMAEEAGVGVLLTGAGSGVWIPGVTAVDPAEVAVGADGWTAVANSPLDPAYTIFTSGSTGRPKGVVVPRGAVVSLAEALEEFGAYAAEPRVVAWNASVAFDASVQQWARICRGDTVVVLDAEDRRDPARLDALLDRYAVTDLDLTPSHWELLRGVLLAPRADGRVLRLFMGGEPVPDRTWREISEADARGELEALNLYGPTEVTVDTTAAWIRGERPHIGAALSGNRLSVLDEQLNPVPDGTEGELYVSGPRLAHGYANRAALSSERFVADPHGEPGSRMYRTGDVVRRTGQGVLEYRGRADRQVKLRGFRVELGEIEAVVAAHPDLAAAVVQVRGGAAGDRLVAYGVPAAGRTPDADELREHAVSALPEYMVPTDFVLLERLPLTPNGKLDPAALPDPATVEPAAPAGDEPQGEFEKLIASVWSGVLERDRVGVEDNFFALGGHSLMALRVVARLKKDLGFSMAVKDVYKHPRLGDLAAYAQSMAAASAGTGEGKQ